MLVDNANKAQVEPDPKSKPGQQDDLAKPATEETVLREAYLQSLKGRTVNLLALDTLRMDTEDGSIDPTRLFTARELKVVVDMFEKEKCSVVVDELGLEWISRVPLPVVEAMFSVRPFKDLDLKDPRSKLSKDDFNKLRQFIVQIHTGGVLDSGRFVADEPKHSVECEIEIRDGIRPNFRSRLRAYSPADREELRKQCEMLLAQRIIE